MNTRKAVLQAACNRSRFEHECANCCSKISCRAEISDGIPSKLNGLLKHFDDHFQNVEIVTVIFNSIMIGSRTNEGLPT